MAGYRDNVLAREEWERRTGGTVTVDQSVTPWLWRARDAGHRLLAEANDLGTVLGWLERLEEADRRRVAFAVARPDARFWMAADGDGPLRYYGSLPVARERIESGPHRELRHLMDVMDALAARDGELRAAR